MEGDLAAFRFCPGCGAAAIAPESAKSVRCGDCGFRYFHNVAAAAGLILRVGGTILFTRRARAPGQGLLDFPGGFVDPGETVEHGLAREVREELGLTVDPDELVYVGSGCNRYPFAGVTYRTADLFFELRVAERPPLQCADDVAAAEWHPLDAIPWGELAFDTVRDAVRRLLARAPGRSGPGAGG